MVFKKALALSLLISLGASITDCYGKKHKSKGKSEEAHEKRDTKKGMKKCKKCDKLKKNCTCTGKKNSKKGNAE